MSGAWKTAGWCVRKASINWTCLSGPLCLQAELSVGVRHQGRCSCRKEVGKHCCKVLQLLHSPLHKTQNHLRHSRRCRVGVWRVSFPYRLHTAFNFHAPLFSSVCVGYYFTEGALSADCLSHSAFKIAQCANDTMLFLSLKQLWLFFF